MRRHHRCSSDWSLISLGSRGSSKSALTSVKAIAECFWTQQFRRCLQIHPPLAISLIMSNVIFSLKLFLLKIPENIFFLHFILSDKVLGTQTCCRSIYSRIRIWFRCLTWLSMKEETWLMRTGISVILGLQWKKRINYWKLLLETTWNVIPINTKVLVDCDCFNKILWWEYNNCGVGSLILTELQCVEKDNNKLRVLNT